MAFAANLRRLRLDRFLSQGELARRAGLHAVTLTRLEAGTTAPSTRSVRGLAEALGVEPRELASPDEVVELRRVLKDARPAPRIGDRRDARHDDEGTAHTEAARRADRPPSGADDRR